MDGSKACVSVRRRGRRSRAIPWLYARSGYTLIDILVSLAVIVILIAILMPSIGQVRETSRRVVCASNVRQHGLGVAMYAEDEHDYFPPSVFSPPPPQFQNMMTVRVGTDPDGWDGLGILRSQDYLDAPGVYYCPSHTGKHGFQVYAESWPIGRSGELISNYQYRGVGPDGRRLTLFAEPAVALVTDGMRTVADYNHKVGCNVMRVDLSVAWFSDPSSALAAHLPETEGEQGASEKVGQAWEQLDGGPRR